MIKAAPASSSMSRILSLRDFRLLFAGAAVSLLGDQFGLIATPWLVLQLTNDPLTLGVILALEGFPRAVFMLFGGAFTDRYSPRRMMLVANVTRCALTAAMAVLVLSGAVQLWMLYAFGLVFGVVSGFAIPAENSIVPLLVDEADLQAGNSLIMGIAQLASFVGPTVAGILIGSFAGSLRGIGLAYALDAFSFVVSAVTLQLIRGGQARSAGGSAVKENMWSSIVAGIKYMWGDRLLRMMFGTLMAANFLAVGPLLVGIPLLADTRLPEGAAAYGLLISAFAGGNLAGYLLAGALPRPRGLVMRLIITVVLAAFGLVLIALGFIASTWIDFALLALIGFGNGYIAILMITWMQIRIPQEMLGRMMALMLVSSSGLVPVSQALSGLVSKWSLTGMFAIPGALVLCLSPLLFLSPELKELSQDVAGRAAEG